MGIFNRRTKAHDDGQAAALADHASGRFDNGPDRPKRRRLAASYDNGYRRAYDGATAEARRAHRRSRR